VKIAFLVLLVMLWLLLGQACDDATPPQSTPSPRATGTPAQDVPARPDDFVAYPQAVAEYLTAHPGAGGGLACLYGLFDAWDMPYFSGERSCRAGNTDGDAELEVAVILVDPTGDEPGPLYSQVALLDRLDATYRVAYTSHLPAMGRDQANMLGNVILTMRDINGDGIGELAYGAPWCGAHTCGVSVHIVSGSDSDYRALTPQDGYSIETPRGVEIIDTDGDGADELILSGGEIQSAGSGPGVLRVDTYAWDGAQYVLRSSIPD
jgi:hypothetical protein